MQTILIIQWVPQLMLPEREPDYSTPYGKHRDYAASPIFIHCKAVIRIRTLFQVCIVLYCIVFYCGRVPGANAPGCTAA